MSFEKLRKPIASITLASTALLGASCGSQISETSQPNKSDSKTVIDEATMSKFENCVAEHSRNNYRYNNILSSFGKEMAGIITVSTCAAIESCPDDDSPSEILAQERANGGTYTIEAISALADPTNRGLVDLDELRACIQTRVYDEHGIDRLQVIGQPPAWFVNRYPTTPDMSIATND